MIFRKRAVNKIQNAITSIMKLEIYDEIDVEYVKELKEANENLKKDNEYLKKRIRHLERMVHIFRMRYTILFEFLFE